MVRHLIDLIEENTDQMDYNSPKHFKDYLINKAVIDRLSFYKAVEEFHQYVETEGLVVNTYMKSISDLFYRDEPHLYDSQTYKK